MATEEISPRYKDIDLWPTADAVDAMLESQFAAVAAVRCAAPQISHAIDMAASRLRSGTGRLIYVGAGTSGRIAVQDGVELGPTYDWPENRLVYLLAGGLTALTVSSEQAEDDGDGGAASIRAHAAGPSDVVIGVAASGRTPYTLRAVEQARSQGALTVGVAGNGDAPLLAAAELAILVSTGPEVVAGSTRMKAGTAQKIALNLLSTGVMLRLGRIHRGLMVNMRLSNAKLRERAVQMVVEIAGCEDSAARSALEQASGNIKQAVLIAQGLGVAESERLLSEHEDNLRTALRTLAQAHRRK